jgi:hypothetical protein
LSFPRLDILFEYSRSVCVVTEDIPTLLIASCLQIVVSLGAGPWDALYGGGNTPAFALASIFSLAAGVLAVLKLPKLSNSYQSAGFHGFG